MEATLSNRDHPEYGTVTIQFPIPMEQYDSCLEQIQALEIGDAVTQDCHVDGISKTLPILDCLKGQQVNFDELNFLAHCVKEFYGDERAQFEASASALGLTQIRDLINLLFCVDNVTVIQNFSNLEQQGAAHYLHIRGGVAPTADVESVDKGKLMRELIASGQGIVTPYGVYYGNGMEMQQLYTGRNFPTHTEDARAMIATLTRLTEPETADDYTLIHFPVPESFLPRAMIRGGLDHEERVCVALDMETGPDEILDVIGDEHTVALDSGFLEELNAMCRTVYNLPYNSYDKLGAVIRFAEPQDATQIRRLAENLGMFEFIPDVQTPEEYAKHLLKDSGLLREDQELAEFFDYKAYGEQQVRLYDGRFSERGYVALHASITLEELMMDDPSEPRVEKALKEQLEAIGRRKPRSRRKKGQER